MEPLQSRNPHALSRMPDSIDGAGIAASTQPSGSMSPESRWSAAAAAATPPAMTPSRCFCSSARFRSTRARAASAAASFVQRKLSLYPVAT